MASVRPLPGVRGGRVSGIDAVRGMAALAVFVCHLSPYWIGDPQLPAPFFQLAEAGSHGVDLFVVISGFCLALPVIDKGLHLSIGSFWKRRAARLLPPYWTALLIAFVFAVLPATYALVVPTQASLGDLLLYVLTLQNLTASTGGTINGSLWSVALEAHLYLLFPLLVVAWRRWGIAPVIVAAAVLSFGWSLLTLLDTDPWGSIFVLPCRLVQFTAGMGCAVLYRQGRVPGRSMLLGGLLVTGGLALLASSVDLHIGIILLWTPPCCVLLLLIAGRAEKGVLRMIGAFGLLSYSFYLIHQPFLLLTADWARDITTKPFALLALGMTVGLVAATGVAAVFYRLVERPSHKLARSVGSSSPSGVDPVPPP